jgi:hypothetical protein
MAREKTRDLVRLLSHYMVYIGQHTGLLSEEWDEKWSACLAPPQWRRQSSPTWKTSFSPTVNSSNLKREKVQEICDSYTGDIKSNFPIDVG